MIVAQVNSAEIHENFVQMTGNRDRADQPEVTARFPWLVKHKRALAITLGAVLVAILLFDEPVTRALTHWPEGERQFFELLTGFGKSDWILLPTLFVIIIGPLVTRFAPISYSLRWALRGVWVMSGFVFLAVGTPGIAAAISKRILGRARPLFFDDLRVWDFQLFQLDWTMHSFPSGHTTTAFAFALALVMLFGKAWRWTFLFAAMIGLSRIVVGAHFLSDVAMGVVFGTLGALLVQRVYLWRGWLFREKDGAVTNRLLPPLQRYWQRLRRS